MYPGLLKRHHAHAGEGATGLTRAVAQGRQLLKGIGGGAGSSGTFLNRLIDWRWCEMTKNSNHEPNAIIGAIAAKHGLLFKPDDPAFALATINEMLMERIANELVEHVSLRLKEFETSFRDLQCRARKLLGQDVREATEGVPNELKRDVGFARLKASELVNRIESTYSRKAIARSVALGIVWAAGWFAAGVCCGVYRPF